jgi:hypothetical protein
MKKIFGINLRKEEEDLDNESYKTIKEEIQEGSRKWEDLPY